MLMIDDEPIYFETLDELFDYDKIDVKQEEKEIISKSLNERNDCFYYNEKFSVKLACDICNNGCIKRDGNIFCETCMNFELRRLPWKKCNICNDHYHNDPKFINAYMENFMICNNCVDYYEDDSGKKMELVTLKNEKCPVCLDEKQTEIFIELPKCNHKLCVKCYSKIYAPYSVEQKKINKYQMLEPIFPYDDMIKHIKYEEWVEKNLDIYVGTGNLNKKKLAKKIIHRPAWMNAPDFLIYEKENIKHSKFVYKDMEKDFMSKMLSINVNEEETQYRRCPLCRK
jgi:hypothetical protein